MTQVFGAENRSGFFTNWPMTKIEEDWGSRQSETVECCAYSTFVYSVRGRQACPWIALVIVLSLSTVRTDCRRCKIAVSNFGLLNYFLRCRLLLMLSPLCSRSFLIIFSDLVAEEGQLKWFEFSSETSFLLVSSIVRPLQPYAVDCTVLSGVNGEVY